MRKMNENERRDKGKNLFGSRIGIHCREKTGVIKQISISCRLFVFSSHGTLYILSKTVKRSLFRFFKFFLIFSTIPPKKKYLLPTYLPTYLPTMGTSNYEKQILLYGRHHRDVVGCCVGCDGRGKQGMVSGIPSVYGVARRVAIREGGTRGFFKHSAKHRECECEEESQKCLGRFG